MKDIYSAAPIRAHAYLMPFDTFKPGAWLLTGIDVAYNERGKGHARELLRRVLADADEEDVTLCLSIEPDGTPKSLDTEQLRSWYRRRGFIQDRSVDSEIAMIREPRTVVYLSTLQFSWGGLFDSRLADGGLIHLVRGTKQGTPGLTLCGIDRFAKDTPGWSVGGGISGPNIVLTPCDGCVAVAREKFSELPVSGIGSAEIAAVLDVESHGHSFDILRKLKTTSKTEEVK